MEPVTTELDFIGQGRPWAISGGTHTQSFIQGGKKIVHGEFITHILTNPTQVLLKSDSFLFKPNQAKTLMVTSLVEYLLTSNGNVRSASIIGASRPNKNRIFDPGMNEDISIRDDVRSTVRNDVGEADKLDATVEGSSTNEWNTAPSRIEESTPKSIFRKVIKQIDSSDRMNLANSLSVQTPELVSFRHPTIHTDNVGDQRSGGVATRIANQDGVWEPTLSNIETAPTHGKIKTVSEKLAYPKFIKDSEFETSKVFEQENIEERENIKDIETRLRMTRIDKQKMENIEER